MKIEFKGLKRNQSLSGYAPGRHSCKCVTCKNMFLGDKRAVQCFNCAINAVVEEVERLNKEIERLNKLNKNYYI